MTDDTRERYPTMSVLLQTVAGNFPPDTTVDVLLRPDVWMLLANDAVWLEGRAKVEWALTGGTPSVTSIGFLPQGWFRMRITPDASIPYGRLSGAGKVLNLTPGHDVEVFHAA